MSLIVFDNAGVRYGNNKEILRDLSFSLGVGDFWFLVGESGAGKSTLLRLMNGTLYPSRGFVDILGHEASIKKRFAGLSLIRREIGMIYQDFKLVEYLDVADNIALPLRIVGAPKQEIKLKVQEMLSWIDLVEHRNSLPHKLSGGQQQRVAIARAVIKRPKIILADEPTGSIDDVMSEKILHMFVELNKQGVAIIFATHNMHLVESQRFPVIVLEHSKMRIVQ